MCLVFNSMSQHHIYEHIILSYLWGERVNINSSDTACTSDITIYCYHYTVQLLSLYCTTVITTNHITTMNNILRGGKQYKKNTTTSNIIKRVKKYHWILQKYYRTNTIELPRKQNMYLLDIERTNFIINTARSL